MSYLDIIVPHCREPWATGKKFFDMLALQRGIDFDEIRVILAQDGEEGRIPFIKYMRYPFQITEKVIPHGGVSAARNAGIDLSGAVWVAFCDFDDMYSSALSLKVALEALRKADKLCLTLVHDTPQQADVFFPWLNPADWKVEQEERHDADERHAFAYTFINYARA